MTARVMARMREHHEQDHTAPLTSQEQRILELIAQGHTNRQIAHENT